MLVHFNLERPIRLETNASRFAIAAILSQLVPASVLAEKAEWRLVAFYSKKMELAERNYETHDSELLAIVKVFVH